MRGMILLLLGLLLAVPSAHAAPIAIGGEDPLVLFGFNPQPEPPPEYEFVLAQQVSGTTAISEVSGISPTPFVPGISPQPFLLSIAATEGMLYPPDPIEPDGNTLTVLLETADGTELSLVFSFFVAGAPDAPLTPLDLFGFNPQPEPPPGYATALAFGFDAREFDGTNTIVAKMQVIKDGDPLALAAVPLPAAGLLLAGSVFMLALFRRRA